MSITYNDLPIVECPHCARQIQIDDYYDLGAGDEVECPNCNKTIYVIDIETRMFARMGSEPGSTG